MTYVNNVSVHVCIYSPPLCICVFISGRWMLLRVFPFRFNFSFLVRTEFHSLIFSLPRALTGSCLTHSLMGLVRSSSLPGTAGSRYSLSSFLLSNHPKPHRGCKQLIARDKGDKGHRYIVTLFSHDQSRQPEQNWTLKKTAGTC